MSQLRWQCRRGMRELDALLAAYVDDCYESADDAEKAAFQAFLALPDPELVAYLLQGKPAASDDLARVLDRILRRTPS